MEANQIEKQIQGNVTTKGSPNTHFGGLQIYKKKGEKANIQEKEVCQG